MSSGLNYRMDLFETKQERRLQKTVRVLVYPNITFQKDLEKDSYVQVIKNQIKLLNELRNDLWFYLILTKPVESLRFENVTQIYIDLPTYPPTMRSHFDVPLFQKILDSSLDFDVVMSHLPEHTHALKNTLYNVTHHVPPFFGYCHWFDVKDVVAWPKDSFIQNITGLLEYDRCYLNTQYQKDLVINQAKETFNDDVINKLNKILIPQHLGVNETDISANITNNINKVIVFNHRPDAYKHFKEFMGLCDSLYNTRQDFKVWIPLLEKPNREYVITDKGDKQWYYNELKKCCVGFSPKQKYGGWSVATTDGMMNGVPYIMYDETYYHELWSNADFFKSDEEAIDLLNKYLDNYSYRNIKSQESLNWVSSNLIYKDEIVKMNIYMNDLLTRQRSVGVTPKFTEMLAFIESQQSVTKKQLQEWLKWGRGIKWSPYRRALMNHDNIFDVNDKEPIYCWRTHNT